MRSGLKVTLSNKHKYKATVLTVDKGHDLALIKINNVPDLIQRRSRIRKGWSSDSGCMHLAIRLACREG